MASCLAVVGCSLAFPTSDYRGTPASEASVEPGADAVAETSELDAGACVVRKFPERPTGPRGGAREITLAFDALELGDQLETLAFSRFDLDGVCTCPAASSCRPPPNERPPCDAPGGVDNAGGTWLAAADLLSGSGPTLSERLRKGGSTLALRIRGYNGERDDADVEATLFSLVSTPTYPRWDGNDVREPNANGLASSEPLIGRLLDTQAFVRDDALVMTFSGIVPIGGIRVPFVDGRVVAKLGATGNATAIVEGHLTGRVPAAAILAAMARLRDPQQGDAGFCASKNFAAAKDLLCRARDIHTDPNLDGRDTPCDALSVGARFTAVAVALSRAVATPPPAEFCASFTDDCP